MSESKDSRSGGYAYKSWGTNAQGNHYCSRDYGPDVVNPNSYHYSNSDGSYYYSNPDGSTYYNDGKGFSIYTPPAENETAQTGSSFTAWVPTTTAVGRYEKPEQGN